MVTEPSTNKNRPGLWLTGTWFLVPVSQNQEMGYPGFDLGFDQKLKNRTGLTHLGMTIKVPTRCGIFALSHSYCLRMRVHHYSPTKMQVGKEWETLHCQNPAPGHFEVKYTIIFLKRKIVGIFFFFQKFKHDCFCKFLKSLQFFLLFFSP